MPDVNYKEEYEKLARTFLRLQQLRLQQDDTVVKIAMAMYEELEQPTPNLQRVQAALKAIAQIFAADKEQLCPAPSESNSSEAIPPSP